MTAKNHPTDPTPREMSLCATLDALAPVVGMLLDCGVSSHELAYLVRWTYVHQAAARLGSPKRRASASRIAAATGLTRADVRTLLAAAAPRSGTSHWMPRASDSVLAGWSTDPDFLDAQGKPRALAYVPSAVGFPELIRRYARDIPPRAMLNEMLESKLVMETSARRYLPVSPTPHVSPSRREAFDGFGAKIGLLGATLLTNLREPDSKPIFDTLLLTGRVSSARRAKIARDLDRRCKTFARAVERYLLDQTRPESEYDESSSELNQVGVVLAVVSSSKTHAPTE